MIGIKQENIYGDNIIKVVEPITIDVERLQNILDSNYELLGNMLSSISNNTNSVDSVDNTSIKIYEKNKLNGLIEFYKNFIEHEESKFIAIEDYVQEYELYSKIDKASQSLKMAIFSYKDKNNHILTPELFNIIIQKHTVGLDNDEKDIMILLIYFLYRECFIGAKE